MKRWLSEWWPLLMGVSLSCLIVGGIVGLVRWSMPDEYHDHKFAPADCVRIRISGEEGMVTERYRYSAQYSVRVALASKKYTAIFGAPNTENQRYAQVRFREFELAPCVGN